jgi:putative peptidoglycan lipid II flippase
MDTSYSVLRLAKRFFAGTVLSRISGVAREMAMAFCFGSAPEIAAFMVAYRLANLFRRIFGEGNLQAGFVPQFESINGENPKKGLLFYRDCSFNLLLLLLGAVALMEISLWLCMEFLEPEWAEIAHLAMWMAPGLVFICLYGLNSAFLQCQKSYFAPAAAPVLFNIAWIAAAILSAGVPLAQAVQFLSIGVAVACACQWGVTAAKVRECLSVHLSWREWFRPVFFSPEWKKLVKPLTLGVVGIGAMQMNSALDAVFARMADLSGPAYLWYAIRIQQLPLALFGIALSGALLPPLSRAMREGALERYRSLLETALRYSAALMIPCTFGLLAVGGSSLNLLYGHGQFRAIDVQKTLYCLWGYGLGLIPAVFILLLATGFYARKSYSIPTIASVVSVVFNLILNVLMVFVFHWGGVSIAIGTSVAALLNCLILGFGLRKEIGAVFSLDFWGYCARLTASGAVAAALTLMAGFSANEFPRSLFEQTLQFGGGFLFYSVSFFGMAYVLKVKELFDLFRRPAVETPRP